MKRQNFKLLGKQNTDLRKLGRPGWVGQLIRALPQYAKVAGSIPGQGTYKNQPMNV